MNKQNVTTIIEIKDGVVSRSRTSSIYQLVPYFQGGSIKWYEDKVKNEFCNTITRGGGRDILPSCVRQNDGYGEVSQG